MKRLALLGMALLLFTTGCGPEVINGISPRDVPIKSLEYRQSGNGEEFCKFIIEEDIERADRLYDCSSKPTEKWEIDPGYRLTEFKANEDTYYYLLEYRDESRIVGQQDQKEFYKVVRTGDGWKKHLYFSKTRLEFETQGLEPTVVKEVHDRP